MAGPSWKLDDDLKTITISFPSDPPVALKLDAANVDDLLKNVGELRAHMTPSVEPDITMGGKVGVIPDPRWATEPDMLNGDSILHIRDPRYGWLHYLLPSGEANNLSNLLSKQVEAKADRPKPHKAN